jgi:hypothetical protein
MSRFQFSLKWLLTLTFGVCCFFGGIVVSQEREKKLQTELKAANERNAFLARQQRMATKLLDARERRISASRRKTNKPCLAPSSPSRLYCG